MKSKKNKKENVSKDTKKKASILESSWIAKITLVVIAIPVVIVLVLLLTSIENSGEPVVGDRFDSHLVNEIKTAQIKTVKESLKYENVDAVSVNLKSATLRILIDTKDDLNAAGIEALANDAYSKVVANLPVETYFTNLTNEDGTISKMYDLEIHVYNVIPDETTTVGQIYAIRYKNASAVQAGFDWVTTPKNQDMPDTLIRVEE